MAAIRPQRIHGKWKIGWALDVQTTGSTPVGYNEYGHMQYENVRSEIGELLYQLKYRGNQSAAQEIITTAAAFFDERDRAGLDFIIPVPASNIRVVQPVTVLANGIGAAVGLPVVACVTTTRATSQLKNVSDPEARKELLNGLYAVDAVHTAGKNILLFDDLFRSGSTMNAITDVLLQQGRAANVYALTITRTRSHQ